MKKIITFIGCSLILLACNKEVNSTSGGTGTSTSTGTGTGTGTVPVPTTQGSYANLVFKSKSYNYTNVDKGLLSDLCNNVLPGYKYTFNFGDKDLFFSFIVPEASGEYKFMQTTCSGTNLGMHFMTDNQMFDSEGGTIVSDGKGKYTVNANMINSDTKEKATLTGTVYVPL